MFASSACHVCSGILKVRSGRLLTSLINPLIRRLLKEDIGNVGLLRLSCDADILEAKSGRLPSFMKDPFTTGRLERRCATCWFEYPLVSKV